MEYQIFPHSNPFSIEDTIQKDHGRLVRNINERSLLLKCPHFTSNLSLKAFILFPLICNNTVFNASDYTRKILLASPIKHPHQNGWASPPLAAGADLAQRRGHWAAGTRTSAKLRPETPIWLIICTAPLTRDHSRAPKMQWVPRNKRAVCMLLQRWLWHFH